MKKATGLYEGSIKNMVALKYILESYEKLVCSFLKTKKTAKSLAVSVAPGFKMKMICLQNDLPSKFSAFKIISSQNDLENNDLP